MRVVILLIVTLLLPGVACSSGKPPVVGDINPNSAREARSLARDSADVALQRNPFEKELDWAGERNGDKWFMAGFFESAWDAKFVVDVTVRDGKVYAHTNYTERPPREWVETHSKLWGLKTLYTRFTLGTAAKKVLESPEVKASLQGRKVLDSAAELVDDTSSLVTWRFALYLQDASGRKGIATIENATEKLYGPEAYGFGATAKVQHQVPASMSAWVSAMATQQKWTDATNLPR